jgi:microcystin-dependent protein
MSEPFIGEIRMFAGNFAPRGWAFCEGQLLPINQNQALFSILGTTYGGDGRTTFGLPDLRGRFPLHSGKGPGLTGRSLGERGGREGVQLTVDEMPSHAHTARASADPGSRRKPGGRVCAVSSKSDRQYNRSPGVDMHDEAIQPVGGNQAHDNMPPYLGLNYIIALTGIFPSRH